MTWLDLPPKPAIIIPKPADLTQGPKVRKLGTFTFPVGLFGGAIERQYLGTGYVDNSDTTSYSFSVNTGLPGLVVVCVGVARAIGSGSISSVTIGGVGASVVQATGRPNNNFAACVSGVAYALSTGGVKTVTVVAGSGACAGCGVDVYLITGYTSTSPHATATGAAFLADATSASASLTVPSGGVAIASLTATQFQGSLTATVLPQNALRYVDNTQPFVCLSNHNLAAGSYSIVNSSGTGCGRAIAAASWK